MGGTGCEPLNDNVLDVDENFGIDSDGDEDYGDETQLENQSVRDLPEGGDDVPEEVLLSSAESDKDISGSDYDDEDSEDVRKAHKESGKKQRIRKTKHFETLPFHLDNFPPRAGDPWGGGRAGKGRVPHRWRGRGGGVTGHPRIERGRSRQGSRHGRGSEDEREAEDQEEESGVEGGDMRRTQINDFMNMTLALSDDDSLHRGLGGREEEDGDDEGDDDVNPSRRRSLVPENRRRGENRPYRTITNQRTKDKWHQATDEFMRNEEQRMLDYADRIYRYLECTVKGRIKGYI